MSYYCENCKYKTESQSNFCNHKKTKKHIKNLDTYSLEKKYYFQKFPKKPKIFQKFPNLTAKIA